MIFEKTEQFDYATYPYIFVRHQAFALLDGIYNNSDFTEGLNAYKNDNIEGAHICFDRLVRLGVTHPILILLHMLTAERAERSKPDFVKRLFICADDCIVDINGSLLFQSDIIIWIQYEIMKEFLTFMKANLCLCEDIDRWKKTDEKLVFAKFFLDTFKENILWVSATFASFLELFIMVNMKEAAVQAIFYSNYINGTVKTQFGEDNDFSKDIDHIMNEAFRKVKGKTKFPYKRIVKLHTELLHELSCVSNLVRTNPNPKAFAELSDLSNRLFIPS